MVRDVLITAVIALVVATEAALVRTTRNCVACIVLHESARRSEQGDFSDVMSCVRYDAFFAARHWPLYPDGGGARPAATSTMAEAYPAAAVAAHDLACATIRGLIVEKAVYHAKPTSVFGPWAATKTDFYRLSGAQFCATDDIAACTLGAGADATQPLAARTVLGALMTPTQQRALDVQLALAYAASSAMHASGMAAALHGLNHFAASEQSRFHASLPALTASIGQVRAAMAAPHTHVSIAMQCETARVLGGDAIHNYVPGWTLNAVRDEANPLTCAAPVARDIIVGQSRFKKEKYGMCVEGDAPEATYSEGRTTAALDKPVWDANDVATIRKRLQARGTAPARPSYGAVHWMPGLHHFPVPGMYEESYGSCVLHLKAKYNEVSTIYNADAAGLGCTNDRHSNPQFDCIGSLASASQPQPTNAFAYPMCYSAMADCGGHACPKAAPNLAAGGAQHPASVQYDGAVTNGLKFYRVPTPPAPAAAAGGGGAAAAAAAAAAAPAPVPMNGMVGMTEAFVQATVRLAPTEIAYVSGNFVKDFHTGDLQAMKDLYFLSRKKNLPVRWVWTLGGDNPAANADLGTHRPDDSWLVPDYHELVSVPLACNLAGEAVPNFCTNSDAGNIRTLLNAAAVGVAAAHATMRVAEQTHAAALVPYTAAVRADGDAAKAMYDAGQLPAADRGKAAAVAAAAGAKVVSAAEVARLAPAKAAADMVLKAAFKAQVVALYQAFMTLNDANTTPANLGLIPPPAVAAAAAPAAAAVPVAAAHLEQRSSVKRHRITHRKRVRAAVIGVAGI